MTKLYEAKDHILICAGYQDPIEHAHMAAQIILSQRGEMRVTAGGREYLCRGILIPPGVSHRIDMAGERALVFLYDSTANVARQIKQVQCLPDAVCGEIWGAYLAFEKQDPGQAYKIFEAWVLQCLKIPARRCCVTDPRITLAIGYIRDRLSERITCREVAEAVFLSEGRFSHLFKAQVGMTFAAYVVYQRLMYGYRQILRGRSITEAALEAGFSGSAHFADVNRRVFGLSASSIVHELRFIKAE